jgi:hypothetical protein
LVIGPIVITSATGNLDMNIKHEVYAEGTPILAYQEQLPVSANLNEVWQVVSDPLGSGHYLIVNPHSNMCIGIGNNVLPAGSNFTDDATDRGAPLTLQARESVNNHYQLWDFLPCPGDFFVPPVFIQNPQTGYVIEKLNKSNTAATYSFLGVNPRTMSNEPYQLWNAFPAGGGDQVSLPTLSMVPASSLKGNSQYVLVPPSQGDHLTGICVTIDIIEDVVVGSCSIQINCNTPYLGPDGVDTEDYDRDAQWMQMMLFMSNNQLTLANQMWHRSGPVLASEFPSETETSPVLLQLSHNTIPAGTRIVMNLCTDQNDFLIGMTGLALDITGLPIGPPVFWPALGRDSFHTSVDGGKVHQKAMAPIGAFQVVFCSNPDTGGGTQTFSSGMGTITTTASPGIAAGFTVFNPFGIGTAENSNMHYALVQSGTHHSISQPFGLT